MGNPVEDPYAGRLDGVLDLRAERDIAQQRIVVTVTDYGKWKPPPSDPGTPGRGLPRTRGATRGAAGPRGAGVWSAAWRRTRRSGRASTARRSACPGRCPTRSPLAHPPNVRSGRCGQSSGHSPVTFLYPVAPPRSTAALTNPKNAACTHA